ncbi:MAG: PAS domain-containing protein [Abitibacteriaceae bacterium]|nr:PAS domain-containing protein [Abditibacteriaceae bacterium]
MEFFAKLFDGSDFVPRAICGHWTRGLIMLHNISDFFIWTAYLAIPVVLVRFAYRRRHELPFAQLFWLFGIFIVACGTTHLMDIVMFYNPIYRFAGMVKLVTAAASWGTVVALVPIVPRALAMRSPQVLEREIEERKRAEAALRESEERFRTSIETLLDGFAIFTAVRDVSGKITDFRFEYINEAGCRMTGKNRGEYLGQSLLEKFPYVTEVGLFEDYVQIVETGEPLAKETTFYNNDLGQNGQSGERRLARAIDLQAVKLDDGLAIAWRDITRRKVAETELNRTAAELVRSNADLEQFAYVASHDLQEPLRAVAGSVQLLQRRYTGKLDERADEFITHAVGGAERMQSLINDLLDFSRVGTNNKPFEVLDSSMIVNTALANLRVAITESGAKITHDELPQIYGDSGQLTRLFQNLVSNALKFRGDQPPEIHIGVERQPDAWQFSVRDNGVGIDPQYFERIFIIFQRLHTRTEYPGTGIGLAICKKIVERHGGQIRVESEPGKGSAFYFTIADRRP